MLYSGRKLQEISFPLGGIGSGSIGLSGNGNLTDWEILNHAAKGSTNGFSFIAVHAVSKDGKTVDRVLQSDQFKEYTGHYASKLYTGFGFGPYQGTMCGFPHFRDMTFDGRYPIAKLTFEDEEFPGRIVLTAFNPFIPLDSLNSSIPGAFFRVEIENGDADTDYTFSFALTNIFGPSLHKPFDKNGMKGVSLFAAGKEKSDIAYGDMTLACDHGEPFRETYWYRGGWQDGISTFWHDFEQGTHRERDYDTPGNFDVCTVGFHTALGAGAKDSAHFVLTWNVPNAYNYWDPYKDESGKDITWKNFYATVWEDSAASCEYSLAHWEEFYKKTEKFRDTLFATTVDPVILDAVSATMSVLKTPTVLRLEDGSFYGWEGLNWNEGSCEGTCTHVWSYAYALCFLFPDLERSLRENECKYDILPTGEMVFRMALPAGRAPKRFRACVDGQMATIVKIYRDWKICGDDAWLRGKWDSVKKLLGYAWNPENEDAWDLDKDGVLEGRQHHTLDMELFGPSSWLESMYLAALKAAKIMAEALGDAESAAEYSALFEKGYAFMKESLFNGKYFMQKIDLADDSAVKRFDCMQYWNEEAGQMKYQIGEGCEIDQMLGQWHADINGLGDIFDPEQRKTALRNLWKNNFKPTLRNFVNSWRVFAFNDEAGTIICTYPDGCEKPIIPIPYCEETMHGFAYALAGLMIGEGMLKEGTEIVKSIRDLYDGEKRNPWNEIECGSNYARSMASFAILPLMSGFDFDLPKGHIGFAPLVDSAYKSFFSLGTGWGLYEKTDCAEKITMECGSLKLKSFKIASPESVREVIADGKPIAFTAQNGCVVFPETVVSSSLILQK